MTVAIAIEAAVIAVLVLFVTGLLRSYAGLLTRLDEIERRPGAVERGFVNEGGANQHNGSEAAHDIEGSTYEGNPVTLALVGVSHHTLLAFLSSSCSSCERFWADLAEAGISDLPPTVRLVAITKSPEQESPAALARLISPNLDVVMSSAAWSDYRVPGSPYFVLVDGPLGQVSGEGTAMDWAQVRQLMGLALGDAGLAAGRTGPSLKARSDVAREAEVDLKLMRAGIFPGDPSLYPSPPDEGQ